MRRALLATLALAATLAAGAGCVTVEESTPPDAFDCSGPDANPTGPCLDVTNQTGSPYPGGPPNI